MLKIIHWIMIILFISGFYFLFQFSRKPYLSISSDHCFGYGLANQTSNDILIYDFFIFNNEFDMLEIHLYELYDDVDLFLIAESNRTLSGKDKPFYLKDNWARFSPYHKKIRRVEVRLADLMGTKETAWHNEARMRDEGIRLALPNSTKDFFLFTSDVDEIPKSRFVHALKTCQLPPSFPPILLQCDTYYYSFEFIDHNSGIWPGGTVERYRSHARVPSGVRAARQKYSRLYGVCFHCSYCFDTIASVRVKLSSFSHTDLNIDRFRNAEHLVDRFRTGKDLFDRTRKAFKRSKINELELPRLLQQPGQRERFMYMLNRSSMANAGFCDFHPMPDNE